MPSPVNNKELYGGIEFSTWLDRVDLLSEEKYLIHKYLKLDLKTVEAGTNGGRILLKMQEMGFLDLSGFDYVPQLIEQAIDRDPNRSIDFQVQDAIDLSYADSSFDQIIYLQQIICLIENHQDRLQAIQESYRILKKGGIGLFSFLSFEFRNSQFVYSTYLSYLKIIRKLRKNDLSIQYLPWLILGGSFNVNSILDRPPYTYWYRVTEIYDILRSVGFEIVGLGTNSQISVNNLKTIDRELLNEEISGMLYVVVKK